MFNLTRGSRSLVVFVIHLELKYWTAVVHRWPRASCLTSMFALWDCGYSIAASIGYLLLITAWVSSLDAQLMLMLWNAKIICWGWFCTFFSQLFFQDVLQQSQLKDDKQEEQSSTFCVPHCPHTQLQHACLPQQNEKSIHVSHLPHLCRTIDPDTMISQCEQYYFQ